ncbi:MAG: hypothetical protein JXA14_20540 [Anaerolineae bacterium]|nr:hypothetical protein [Anaerolineae bacterium]
MNGIPVKRWLRCAACIAALALVASATPQKTRAQEDPLAWMEDVLTKTARALDWSASINYSLDGTAGSTLDCILELGGVPWFHVYEEMGAASGYMMIIDVGDVLPGDESCDAREWITQEAECSVSFDMGDNQWVNTCAEEVGTPTFMHEYAALEANYSDYGTCREVRWSDGRYVYIVIQSGYAEGEDLDGDGLFDELIPPCDGDRCIGTFGTHKDQSGNPTGCPDRDHDGLVDEPPDAIPSGDGYSCPALPVDDRVDAPPPGGQGPHWEWAEVLYHYASITPKDDSTYNLDPEITNLYCSPEYPSNTDTVVITVAASDPDGDTLSYIWVVDNVRQSANSPQVTWANPPPGPHEVVVTVTDSKGGEVERSLSFHVTEASVPGDRDDDGVRDNEDRCPDEFGLNDDGCPDFGVTLGCLPAVPEEHQEVVCAATAIGVHPGEALRFDWYLDDASVADDYGPIWIWSQAAAGAHDVEVMLTGESRDARAVFTLGVEAEKDLVVRIGMVPDPPVAGAHVDFVANVEGKLADENLTYAWYFDDAYVGSGESYAWDKAVAGESHTIAVKVLGREGREAADTRGFSVPTAPDAVAGAKDAGFKIVTLDCSDRIASDETLACTVRIDRERSDIGVLNVVWLINRATAAEESTVGDSATWTLDAPAPGTHSVEVRVINPETGDTQAQTASVAVRPGANVPISPGAQIGAAVGTTTAIGAWLWLEWWRQRRAAAAEAALQRDRQQWYEREMEQTRLEREYKLRREGFEYKEETDTWEMADYHPDKLAQRIRAEIHKAEGVISKLMERLPEGRWSKIEDLAEKLSSPTNPNVDDLRRIMQLRQVVFESVQAQWEGEAARATLDAIWYQEWETGISRVRLIGEVIGLTASLLYPPATAAAAARLAALDLGGNFVEGAVEGYVEGGFTTALGRAAQYTLPVNTVVSIYETVKGDHSKESWGQTVTRIGLSVVRDVGNAFSLREGTRAVRTLMKKPDVASRAYRRMTEALEEASGRFRHQKVGDIDAQWLTNRRRGQQLVDQFEDTYARYRKATNRAERKALLQELREQAIQINSSYQAKAILKAQGGSKLAQVFDNRIQRVYREVDAQAIGIMNQQMKLRRGGRQFTVDDMFDIRNKSSWGTAGMDRDWALNEKYINRLKNQFAAAAPGSDEAQAIARELMAARRRSAITMNDKRISLAKWNEQAEEAYRQAYKNVTKGQNADEAFQGLTQSQNPEAYADLGVLENNPVQTPFRRQWSAQTASVTAYKAYRNQQLVQRGLLSQGDAIQETFRGLEKDMRTKLRPLLESGSQQVPFPRQQRLEQMERFFKRVGDGQIAPGQATQILQQHFGVTLDQAVEEITSNLETAVVVCGR